MEFGSDASSDSEEAMDVVDDGRQAPSTPKAPATQTVDLSTPRPPLRPRNALALPSGPQPEPTGQVPLPVTPAKPLGSSQR